MYSRGPAKKTTIIKVDKNNKKTKQNKTKQNKTKETNVGNISAS
jgi:hypothetical protein